MLPVFLINLDRAAERLAAVKKALPANLDIRRVAALDGREIAEADRIDTDHATFRKHHGRPILPGEYGCYRSHLAALERVVESGLQLALIAEDDVVFDAALKAKVEAIVAERPDLDALKLVNHRVRGFIRHGSSASGDVYGRCLHGPQGSAACYAVTRHGAERLRTALATMHLPYDVALERGWATKTAIYTTRENLVGFSEHRRSSFINADAASRYAAGKPPAYKRLPTAAFRAQDYARRMLYALSRT